MEKGEQIPVLNNVDIQVLIVLNQMKTRVLSGGVHFLYFRAEEGELDQRI
jgi:hypothetical protein